ncbi:hypothetical protein FRB97_001162 [Tulasnella sp. 331]|nr:hypothetical protein FRB97_001162 [Tulasnella sp. 331]
MCADNASTASDWFILEVGSTTVEVKQLPEALQVMAGNVATLNISAIHQQITLDGAQASASDHLVITLDNSLVPWLLEDGSTDIYRGLAPITLANNTTTLPVIVTVRDRFENTFSYPYALVVYPTWFTNSALPLLVVTLGYPLFLNIRDYMRLPINSSLNVTMQMVSPMDPVPTWLRFNPDAMTLAGTVSAPTEATLISLEFIAFDIATGLISSLSQEILVNPVTNVLGFHDGLQKYPEILLAMIGASSTVCAIGLCLIILWAWVYRRVGVLPMDHCRRIIQDGSCVQKTSNCLTTAPTGVQEMVKTASAALETPIEALDDSRSMMRVNTGRTQPNDRLDGDRDVRNTMGYPFEDVDRHLQWMKDQNASVRLVDRELDVYSPLSRNTTFSHEATYPQIDTAPYKGDSLDDRDVLTGQTSSLYRLFEEGDDSVILGNRPSFHTQGPDERLTDGVVLGREGSEDQAEEHHTSTLAPPLSEYPNLQRGTGGDEVPAQNWLYSHPEIGQQPSTCSLAFTGSPELGHELFRDHPAFSTDRLGRSSTEIPLRLDSFLAQPPRLSTASRHNFDPDAPTPAEFYNSEDSFSGGSSDGNRSKASGEDSSSNAEPARGVGFRSRTVQTVEANPTFLTNYTNSVVSRLPPEPPAPHVIPSSDSRDLYKSSPESQQSQGADTSRKYSLKPQWDWSLRPVDASNVPCTQNITMPDPREQLGSARTIATGQAEMTRSSVDRLAIAERNESTGTVELSTTWEF